MKRQHFNDGQNCNVRHEAWSESRKSVDWRPNEIDLPLSDWWRRRRRRQQRMILISDTWNAFQSSMKTERLAKRERAVVVWNKNQSNYEFRLIYSIESSVRLQIQFNSLWWRIRSAISIAFVRQPNGKDENETSEKIALTKNRRRLWKWMKFSVNFTEFLSNLLKSFPSSEKLFLAFFFCCALKIIHFDAITWFRERRGWRQTL